MRRLASAGLALLLGLGLGSGTARAHGSPHGDAGKAAAAVDVASPAPLFDPPPPGSYELPPIDQVSDHVLIDDQGLPARFPELGAGQVAVVSFVYSSCGQGCPLALATLQRLDHDLAARAGLRGKVRLVTVSFDPARDTPERMAELRTHLVPRSEWRFVTAPDGEALEPVLADYGQSVMRLVDPDGADTGLLGHVLKVFLVDEFLRIRNVYSAGLMDARLILNDIQTVLAD